MTDPERRRRVEELCDAALHREGRERAAFVAVACGADEALRHEVEALLAHAQTAEGFLVTPMGEVAAHVLAEEHGASLVGRQIGSYKILSLLGAGGMGDVYRARDTTLGRDVAIKVVADAFLSDPERLARFEREARVLATLNHPHIGAIYGLEEADPSPGSGQAAVRALVLELVEGETLAERLAVGPLPTQDALTVARQIADALEAAHEKGIVHRDLKPGNVKITPDGTVKVLDFGLAKVGAGDGAAPDLSQSPTVPPGRTRDGVILGTAAYMSPEQARGQAIDKRTDIWAFGCVLYEMLTGRVAFAGDTTSDTIARVLERDPDWRALPGSTPTAIGRLLHRCLAKERRNRLPDIGVARLDIVDVLTSPDPPLDTAPAPPGPPLRLWQRPTAAAIIVLSLVAMTGLAVWGVMRPPPATPVRLTVAPPPGETVGIGVVDPDVTIAPDGTRIVFVAGDRPPARHFYVRDLDQLVSRRLEGLGENPRAPFMSPDGNWVGFFDEPKVLRKVAVNGGPAVTITSITGGVGGASWGVDDTIVFATGDPATGLLRVSGGGGTAEVLTMPDAQKGERDHHWPDLLPGGRAVLFTIVPTSGGMAAAQIAVLDLETGEQKVLLRGGSYPRYVPTGHIVYGADGTLRAVAFDLGRLEVRSDSFPVVQGAVMKPSGAASFGVAQNGSLVYLAGTIAGDFPRGRRLVWIDRQGREEPIKAPPRLYVNPRLSPDGTRVAVNVVRGQDSDVWIWHLANHTLTRLTFGEAWSSPVWTPDGRRIAFSSSRNPYWQAADGTGTAERLAVGTDWAPTSFSPDGTQLLFDRITPGTGFDMGILSLKGNRQATPLVKTSFNELNPELSPDGHWLAYQSNESGQHEVYVRPFPEIDRGRWQVSTGGGRMPVWARRGRELFYLDPSGAVMRVPVESGETFGSSNPTKLVGGGYVSPLLEDSRTYDVSADGQRFLMIKEAEIDKTSTAREIVIVQHWLEELTRLVPTK